MNNPQIWQAIAAIVAVYAAVLGGAYAVITVPLRRAINRQGPVAVTPVAFIRKEGKYAHAPQPDLIAMDLHLLKNVAWKFWRRFAETRSSPISSSPL